MADDPTRLLSRALRAICLTRDYVGSDLLPAIKGWEWYDAGVELSAAIPDDEWADEFRKRTRIRRESKFDRQRERGADDPIQRLHNFVDGISRCDDCEAVCDKEEDPVVLCGKCAAKLRAERGAGTCGACRHLKIQGRNLVCGHPEFPTAGNCEDDAVIVGEVGHPEGSFGCTLRRPEGGSDG